MSVMVVLIGASLGVALIFLVAFIYSVKKGQFDDKETPAIRMLFDDKTKNKLKDKSN